MKYHVLNNLNHDCKEYQRGDTLDLPDDSKAAPVLLEAGVISTDAPREEAPETAPAAQEPVTPPEVGGSPNQSGEPSIDAPEAADAPSEEEDVTPEVSEKMTRPELEALAAKKGIPDEQIKDAPNKGVLVDLITNAKPEPEVDPSANL